MAATASSESEEYCERIKRLRADVETYQKKKQAGKQRKRRREELKELEQEAERVEKRKRLLLKQIEKDKEEEAGDAEKVMAPLAKALRKMWVLSENLYKDGSRSLGVYYTYEEAEADYDRLKEEDSQMDLAIDSCFLGVAHGPICPCEYCEEAREFSES